MKKVIEYYELYEEGKLDIADGIISKRNDYYKKFHDAMYYVGYCFNNLDNIELELDEFSSLIKYAMNLDFIGLNEEKDLVEYAELIKRIPSDISSLSKAMYLSILEDVYSKNFFEMYNLEEGMKKYLYGDPFKMEADSKIYFLRDEFDKYVKDSLQKIEDECRFYPKEFIDNMSYIFLDKNYELEYMFSNLPSSRLVTEDYREAPENMVPYSVLLYEDYLAGDKELTKYPEVLNNYKIYKKGENLVPFTKSEFIKDILENRKVKSK